MWKNTVESYKPQLTIRRMRIACWIGKATNTHSEYVILTALPVQKWLHERASTLRCMYIACLIFHIILLPVKRRFYIFWHRALLVTIDRSTRLISSFLVRCSSRTPASLMACIRQWKKIELKKWLVLWNNLDGVCRLCVQQLTDWDSQSSKNQPPKPKLIINPK